MAMVAVRRAIQQDIRAIFLVSVAAHRANYDALIPDSHRARFIEHYTDNPTNEQAFSDLLLPLLSDTGAVVLVAECGGEVVGYACAERGSYEQRQITRLFVLPAWQGKGIGRRLFESALDWLGSGPIQLIVVARNSSAIHLYTNYGFRIHNTVPANYFGAEQVLMTRDLGGVSERTQELHTG